MLKTIGNYSDPHLPDSGVSNVQMARFWALKLLMLRYPMSFVAAAFDAFDREHEYTRWALLRLPLAKISGDRMYLRYILDGDHKKLEIDGAGCRVYTLADFLKRSPPSVFSSNASSASSVSNLTSSSIAANSAVTAADAVRRQILEKAEDRYVNQRIIYREKEYLISGVIFDGQIIKVQLSCPFLPEYIDKSVTESEADRGIDAYQHGQDRALRQHRRQHQRSEAAATAACRADDAATYADALRAMRYVPLTEEEEVQVGYDLATVPDGGVNETLFEKCGYLISFKTIQKLRPRKWLNDQVR